MSWYLFFLTFSHGWKRWQTPLTTAIMTAFVWFKHGVRWVVMSDLIAVRVAAPMVQMAIFADV